MGGDARDPNSLRIGVVCYPTYGGSGVVATELGLALAELGHDIHFISYAPPFRLPGFHPRVYYHEVTAPEYPLFAWQPYDLALASRIVRVCQEADLDLIHSHYALPHAIAAYLARQMLARESRPLRTVTTLHGTDITLVGNDPSYLPATRFGLQESDAVTAVSDWLAQETRRLCVSCKDITVVPNFVDADRFHPDRRDENVRRTYAPRGEPIVLHVSNLRPVKRVQDVIASFALLAADTEAVLLIVGDGPDRAKADAAVAAAGLEGRVHFLGNQDGVEVLLASADVFFLPSEFESFGLSALEAMACGVPVVATNSGGLPEVIEDGVTGRLVSLGDVRGFAGALRDLVRDPAARTRMGERAREVATTRFKRDNVVAHYLRVYRSVLEPA